MRYARVLTAIVAAAGILVVLCAFAMPPPTHVQADARVDAPPTTCRVGIYLRALHAFDPAADTFGADLWLWSVCPSENDQPLQTMEFVTAEDVSVLLDVPGQPFWANRNVDGTFRHEWDERNFPFDRHTLTIELEEGVNDVRKFIYDPDFANSGVDPAMQLPGGWKMTGIKLAGGAKTYDTTFGDPDLPEGGGSEYSRLTLSIDLVRTDLSGFFKLTAVVYSAFIFSFITYFMHLETTTGIGARVSLLAIALFSAAVNLLNASADLGTASGLTLVDKIHMLVLFYILVAAIVTVVSRLLVDRGWEPADVARLNYRVAAIVAFSFIVINIVFIGSAARGG